MKNNSAILFTNGERVTLDLSNKEPQWVGGSAKIKVIYADGSSGYEHVEDIDIQKSALENLGYNLTN